MNCGKKLEPMAKFCSGCGLNLSSGNVAKKIEDNDDDEDNIETVIADVEGYKEMISARLEGEIQETMTFGNLIEMQKKAGSPIDEPVISRRKWNDGSKSSEELVKLIREECKSSRGKAQEISE